MKNIYFTTKLVSAWIGFGFMFLTALSSCKKSPIDNVRIVIDPDIIKYSMLLDISDAADNKIKPADVSVSFSGQDAEYIYEAAGKKKFKVQQGLLNIGLGPERILTSGNPAKFTVTISANGYLPVSRDLEMTADRKLQIATVKLINISRPPEGLEIMQQSVSLVNGAVSQGASYGISSRMPSVNKKLASDKFGAVSAANATPVDEQTQVVLPQGIKFYYLTQVQTGVTTIKSPITTIDTIHLAKGNGTATYSRITGYEEKEVPVMGYVKKYAEGNIKINAIYRKGDDVPYSIYPYNSYSSFDVKLLTGQTVAEDKLLYKTAVYKKLIDLYFTAEVSSNGTNITCPVTPDQGFQWYTSFVLNPASVNPVTGRTIAAGDDIESGVDQKNKTTLRTKVKEVVLADGSKQLRAESKTVDIGYYYPAVYTTDYNYTFNTSFSGGVADPENVTGYLNIRITTGGQNLGWSSQILPSYGEGSHDVVLSGKVRSFTPIQLASSYGAAYWGVGYGSGSISSSSGTYSVFNDFQIKIEPTVSLDLKFVCPSKIEYLGFGTAYITGSDGKSGWAQVKNGKWATNGFTQGQTYHAEINIDGGVVKWDNTITKTTYVEKHSLQTCPDK